MTEIANRYFLNLCVATLPNVDFDPVDHRCANWHACKQCGNRNVWSLFLGLHCGGNSILLAGLRAVDHGVKKVQEITELQRQSV